MKTEIQKTELYQQFKKALGINDMRTDDNPYIVECCKIAEDYAKLRLSAVSGQSEQLVCEHPDEAIIRDKPTDYCLACNRNI